MPFSRAKAVAEKALAWRQAEGPDEFCVDIIGGYAADPEITAECHAFNRVCGETSTLTNINGQPFRSEGGIRRFLLSLKDAGATGVCASFYGVGETHDRFAGRKGDFDQVLLASRLAGDVGLPRHEAVYLWHGGVRDLPALMDILDGIPGRKGRSIYPFDYRGRAKALEHERATASDVEPLPKEVMQYMNLTHARPECEWLTRIEAGESLPRGRRYYMICISEENIEWLESTAFADILWAMKQADEQLRNALPALETLARLYGDPSGDRLYRLRDLDWKWTDAYLADHPKVDSGGRFDDLTLSIMWH